MTALTSPNFIRELTPADPATVFISYARDDEKAGLPIEKALQERGIRVLRDKPSMTLGANSPSALPRMIDAGCDAILFYITDKLLRSEFIWRFEVPTALTRWRREPNFHIIPVLQGVTYSELTMACADKGFSSLADFNAETVRRKTVTMPEAARIARRTLRSALTLRMIRGQNDEPVNVCLRTFEFAPPSLVLHLDLNWTQAFATPGATPDDWRDALLPALDDVSNAIAQSAGGRVVDIWMKARLPVGIATGHAFPPKGSNRLRLRFDDEIWATFGDGPSDDTIAVTSTQLNKDDHSAIVEVGVTREINKAVTRWREEMSLFPRWRVRCVPIPEPSRSAITNGGTALSWARRVGDELRGLWDREEVRDVHLFAASSIEFAVMLGQQFHDPHPVHVYFADGEGKYQRAYTLGK